MLILSAWTFERDDHAALIAFTDALGADIFTIREGDMDDSAFVGWHGLEGDGAAIVADLLGHAQGQGTQVLFATLAVILRVNDNAHTVLGAMADNQADEQLQCSQGFTAPPDEQAQIFVDAVNVE